MEFIQTILNLIGGLTGLLFSLPEFRKLKIIVSAFAILFSIGLIGYWIYLERKYKFGIELWKFLIKYYFEAFIKPDYFDKGWTKIKNIFLSDYFASLMKVYKYLEEVADLYGYEESSLIEKFNKIPDQIFPNKERFLKALEALEIIKSKLSKNEKVEISEIEVLAILKEIELGLQGLFVITHKALWANFLALPSNK